MTKAVIVACSDFGRIRVHVVTGGPVVAGRAVGIAAPVGLHVGAILSWYPVTCTWAIAATIEAANNAIAISVFTFGYSFFWLMFWTHQEHKKTADLHQAAESSVEISRSGDH